MGTSGALDFLHPKCSAITAGMLLGASSAQGPDLGAPQGSPFMWLKERIRHASSLRRALQPLFTLLEA